MQIPLFLTYLILPGLLYLKYDLMVYSTIFELQWQIRLYATWIWLSRLNDIIFSLPTEYSHGQRMAMSSIWMSPYVASTLVRCHLLPKWLGGTESVFTASGSIHDQLHERNLRKRAPLHRRFKLIIMDCYVWFHAIYIVYACGGPVIDFIKMLRKGILFHGHSSSTAYLPLVVKSMLPPMWWLLFTTSFLVPIFYTI
jgi:hypothetical protein